MNKSTNVSDKVQFAVYVCETDVKFSIIVEVDALMSVRRTTRGAHLYE